MKAEVIAEHKADLLKTGLNSAGYKVVSENKKPSTEDVLVAWNRKSNNEGRIRFYEEAGAKVLIAENGYIGRDSNGHKLISLAHNHHLGLGKWLIGKEERYKNHNFNIEPWRVAGEDIVLLAQRGIGNSKRLEWYMELADKIRKKTTRKVRIRKHPGKNPTPLFPDIDNAHAVVTYSSAAALSALAYGVPVFYLMKGWIGAGACKHGIEDLENPLRAARDLTFHRIGWAQWTVEEIINGQAIREVMAA